MTETSPVHVEKRDVNARAIVAVAGGLIVAAVIVHLVSWWLFDSLQAREREDKRSRFPLSAELRGQLPPEPRLEEIDRLEGRDLAGRLYAGEMKRLESYGWVDEKAGIVRIPIERAMKRVVAENRTRP